ncbi:MAG: nuclear transport factor 2 family protein, partial [Actinomycetota bacterium]
MDPAARIEAYFLACGEGSVDDIAAHFTPDAVIYDTNLRPARGADAIGRMWVKVRDRWGGARWSVDSVIEGVGSPGASVAAIEWSMTGCDLERDRPFIFRGSEHYRFERTLISEIRQYWTFDPERLDTHLIDYDYTDKPNSNSN